MSCPDQIDDCNLKLLDKEALIKLVLRKTDECYSLSVKNQLTEPVLTSSLESMSGNVAAGSLTVTFTTSSDFTGSINGVSREPGSYTFHLQNTINPQIPYTITTGSIVIDKYTQS